MPPIPTPLGRWRPLALAAGPALHLAVAAAGPAALGPDARQALGLAGWMVLWWLTEPVPLAATSLLPLVILPLGGVVTMRDATAPYANEMIFLFMAGFFLAAALERWNAHQRLALRIVRGAGTSGRRVVLALMTATALLSMWISNTATAAMLYPIAMALGHLFGEGAEADRLRTALLLGLAYAASIGGMGTLLGTPPNLILAASAQELLGRPLDFARFLVLGLPCVLVLLPVCWLLLVRVFFPAEVSLGPDVRALVKARERRLGPIAGAERRVLVVFGLAALGWLLREPKAFGAVRLPGLVDLAPGLTDAAIGMAAAVLLFVVQAPDEQGDRRPLLTWGEACRIPWDVLLLFGGGLSLAAALEGTGVTAWIGQALAGAAGLPALAVSGLLATASVALSELASNTAVAAMVMPLAAGLAEAASLPPFSLMAVAALAASAGFALPIATPPNALVYGTGRVTARQMLGVGLALDAAAIVVVVTMVHLLGRFAL